MEESKKTYARSRLSKLACIIALLAILISLPGLPYATTADAQPAAGSSAAIMVEPEIAAKINAEGSAGYMIYFREKPNMSRVSSLDRKTQGEFVANSLMQASENAQARVRTYLDAHKVPYKSFWIDNIIVVEKSNKAVFDGLMQFSEIASIKARRTMKLHEPVERGKPGASKIVPMAVEPNITHVKADQVWALGYTGSGVVVANIDTGVRYTHQALVNHYRGNTGGGTYNHNYNWYDPYGDHPTSPADDNGHGSHTMGTIVGDDGSANQIGMAHGAQWIACRGCNTSSCTDTALLTCAQFMAAPTDLTGANPDSSKRPNVVNNSWGDCGQTYDNWYRTVVDNWQAAGIYPVFSNGNASNCGYTSPPPCNTVGNPGRYGNVTGVGSTGQTNGQYATHSNRGPTDDLDLINPNGYASLKPQVAAPGVNIRSSVPDSDSSYEGGWSGTSMSAPHVTGLIALMLQAAPCLTYSQAETIIEETANQNTTGLPGTCSGEGPGQDPNQSMGWGEIDALAAVNQALGACGPAGTLNGTVTNASTSNPIEGVTVRADSRSATTNASGQYTFASVPVGSYTVTAAVFGYDNGTASGVVIADGQTTTQDFSLTPKAQVTVSGTVTDGSGQGWPLYATIAITAPGFSTTIMTNPVTGQYSVNLVEETNFTFSVSASGYTTQETTVTTGTGSSTQNFSLLVSGCEALGYSGGFTENFDSLTPPALPVGWTVADVSGTSGNWATNAGTRYPSGQPAHSSPNLIFFNSFSTSGGEQTRLYRTSGVDLSGVSSASLSFWMYHDTGYSGSNDRVQVQVSTNGGSIWNDAGSPVSRYNGTVQWTQHTVDLTAYTGPGNTDVRVALHGISNYGNDIHIDDIAFGSCSALSGGLVAGMVYDANTSLPLAGVTVKTGSNTAVSDSAGTYVLFASAGTQDVTAVGPTGYDNVTQSVSVSVGSVTGQDFNLPAGLLAANPTSITFNVDFGGTASHGLTLNNTGTAAATWEIKEINGSGTEAAKVSIPWFTGTKPTGSGPLSMGRAPNAPVASGAEISKALNAILAGEPAYAVDAYPGENLVYFPNTTAPGTWNVIASLAGSQYFGGDFLNGDFTTLYVVDSGLNQLHTVNTATGAVTVIGSAVPYGGESLTGLTGGSDGILYASSAACGTRSTLHTINPSTGAATVIGEITNGSCIIDIAMNAEGEMYGVDIVNDNLIQINPATGAGTIVGLLGVDANYAQGMDFEEDTGVLYWAAYTTQGELRIIDTTTGASSLVGAFPGGAEVDSLAFATGGSSDVEWLSETPTTGSTPAGGNASISVSVNAAGLAAGTYNARLRITNGTPYGDVVVPVTLHVAAAPVTTTTTVAPTTTTTVPACVDNDGDGYFAGDNCTPLDCNDDDAFYTDICPNCEVRIMPRALGWFLGEKEKTRRLMVIGKRGTEFDDTTPVRWESDGITVVSKRVFFKRFMFMQVSLDGAALGKGDHRALIGTCSAALTLVK